MGAVTPVLIRMIGQFMAITMHGEKWKNKQTKEKIGLASAEKAHTRTLHIGPYR